MLGVVVDLCACIVVADDAVVADAEAHHADGAFLAEPHAVAIAVAREGDAVGRAVVEDVEEGGLQLEVCADACEGDVADAHLAGRLREGEQLAPDAVVLDVHLVLVGEVGEPFVLVEHLDPLALPHVEGEGVGHGTQVGEGAAPHILRVGGLAAAVGVEGGLDEVAVGVHDGLAAALDGAQHDVGTHAAVEVGLAMDMVAEVVAFGLVLVDVAQGPGA